MRQKIVLTTIIISTVVFGILALARLIIKTGRLFGYPSASYLEEFNELSDDVLRLVVFGSLTLISPLIYHFWNKEPGRPPPAE